MTITSKARALALLGQLELVFEHSGVPIPPKAPTKRTRKAKTPKPRGVTYDRDRFPVGHAARRFAKLVYSALVSTGSKIPRWPDSEDTGLSGRIPGAPITLHEMRFAAEHFKERGEPKHAKRVREELNHWRAQAKAGEAPEVLDQAAPPAEQAPPAEPSPTPAPAEPAREYTGPKLPRWVEDGARVRVKVTPWLRKHGLTTSGGAKGDSRAWPKEVGTIRRRDGNGWWDWVVEFERGRRVVLDEQAAGYLIGVRDEPPAPEPPSPAPEGATLEAAIVADALEAVDRAPYLPRAADVRIYLRAGRKYIRVFWVNKSMGPDGLGSVLYFVEKATGQVYRARSSKAVGAATGRFIRPGAEPSQAPAPAPDPAPSGELALRKLYGRSERLTWQRVFADIGMPRADQEAQKSGIQVRKANPRAVSVEWVAWGGEGEDARRARFDEALERLRSAGYGFHLLSGEIGEAAVEEGRKRGIVIVHRSKAAAATRPADGGPVARPTPTRANHPNLALKGLTPGRRLAIEGEPYTVRSAAGGSSTWSVESGRGTGPDLYELKHERSGRIARLRVPGVVDQERDDASPLAGTIAVTFGAKSSFGDERTVYGPRVELLGSKTRSPAKKSSGEAAPKADTTAALELARAHGRAVVQLGEVYIDAVKPGTGAKALEAVRTVLEEAVRQLKARPTAERRAFVDEVKPAYRGAVELARSVEGEGWRRGGEPLLRRGTHARIFTEDLDRAFRALDVPRRYVLESPLSEASAKSPEVATSPAEEWERHRVVWFRPVDAGESLARVELRRGDTAWVSLGRRDGKPRGFWASVNGISKAKRQLKMGEQWVELPLVYTRDEMAGEDMPPSPDGAPPPKGSDFAALLEGLRTQRVRTLRFPDTAWTPHTLKVSRVLSLPGKVVVEGTVKRSKAKLTIATDVDERGRPTKYARMQRGTRYNRVDPKLITSPSSASSSSADGASAEPVVDTSPPTPGEPAAPAEEVASSGLRETAHQRARRERAERKAKGLGRLAEAQWEDARAETKHIPLGQPILVGHHSERRHRNALDRQHRKAGKAIETLRAAEAAESAAKRAGYAISSDDPEAIEALEARLAEMEASRVLSKAINAAYRKGGWEAVEQVPGVTPKLLASAKRTMEVAHWLKVPMDLKNLGANIRRVKKRIEELKAAAEREAAPAIEGEGFAITEHPDDNRIRFTFAERPGKDVTAKMKRAGFRWSRRHGAWQRHLNNAGRYAAERMAKELFGWDKRAEGGGSPYPADVLEEAEELGWTPERVLEVREKSRREEEEMGRKMRQAARAEEAAHARGSKPDSVATKLSDSALAQLEIALRPLTVGTQETRTGQSRLSGPLLASAERTPSAPSVRVALLKLVEAAKRCPTKAARNRLRKQVSDHLKVARRHAKRIERKHGAGSRALRDARKVRDLLDEARAEIVKGT